MSHASREIWNWRAQAAAEVARPERERARLRRRGLVQGLVIVIVGTLLNRGLGHELAGRILVVIGALQGFLGLVRPLWLGAMHRQLLRFGELVGRALAWLLLGPLWLLVFVPGSIVLRLQRRDPLHRAPLDAGLTAWIPRRRPATAASCERQFLDEDREARALARPEGSLPPAAWLDELRASAQSAQEEAQP
jgi:hypothetical protein